MNPTLKKDLNDILKEIFFYGIIPSISASAILITTLAALAWLELGVHWK